MRNVISGSSKTMQILFGPVTIWQGEVYTYDIQTVPLLVQSYRLGQRDRVLNIKKIRYKYTFATKRSQLST